MALKAIVKSVEGLPADVAKEYTKREDGTFVLAVDAVDGFGLENATSLRKALESERSKAHEYEAKYKGIDPDQARGALAKLDEIAKWTPDQKVQEHIAQQVKQVEAKASAEIEKATGRSKMLQSALETTLIDQRASTALVQAGLDTPDLLLPHIRSRVRVKENNGQFAVEVFDPATGVARISPKSGSTGPMSLEELVDEMKEDRVFGRAFPGSGTKGGGSGASPSSPNNAGGRFTISQADARDVTKYRIARESAAKAGAQLEIV